MCMVNTGGFLLSYRNIYSSTFLTSSQSDLKTQNFLDERNMPIQKLWIHMRLDLFVIVLM